MDTDVIKQYGLKARLEQNLKMDTSNSKQYAHVGEGKDQDNSCVPQPKIEYTMHEKEKKMTNNVEKKSFNEEDHLQIHCN